MGRPRAFDEKAAVDAATNHFWHVGYEATSVRDLGSAMSLTTASLYNAFGDKRSLFRRCFNSYLDSHARRRIGELDAHDNPEAGIREFFEGLVEASINDRRGCLLINSAMEVAPHDPEMAALVRDGLREVEDGFYRALMRVPDVDRTPDARRAVARLMLSAVMAMRVLARTGGDDDRMRSIAHSAVMLAVGSAKA